jgi:hypothetical protein
MSAYFILLQSSQRRTLFPLPHTSLLESPRAECRLNAPLAVDPHHLVLRLSLPTLPSPQLHNAILRFNHLHAPHHCHHYPIFTQSLMCTIVIRTLLGSDYVRSHQICLLGLQARQRYAQHHAGPPISIKHTQIRIRTKKKICARI